MRIVFGENFPHPEMWGRKLAIAWLAQFLTIIGMDISLPFIPFYIRELGITDQGQISLWAGAIAAACSIVIAVISPIWGMLADRKGPKLMLLRAAFGAAATLAIMAYVTNVQQLLIIRAIQGGLTGITLAFVMMVSSFAPVSRMGYSLGLMQMGAYLAFSIGPIIGGVIADTFGYRATFTIASIFPLLGGILIYFFIDNEIVSKQNTNVNTKGDTRSKDALGAIPLTIFLLVLTIIFIANASTRPLLPLLVENIVANQVARNVSTGTVFSVFFAASAISATFIGRIGDRIGLRRILIICGAGAALSYIGQSLSTNLFIFLVMTFFVGLCVGGLLPTANTFIAHVASKGKRSTIYGWSNSISSVGRAIGPLMGGAIAATLGLRAAFTSAGILLATFTIIIALMLKPQLDLVKPEFEPSDQ